MKVYKGTDKDMRCRGMQYELGKEYVHDGEVKACQSGFHSCKNPLDVLRYYPLKNGNRYFSAEADGIISGDTDDSKIASEKITLSAEIGIPGIIRGAVEYVKAICADAVEETASGNSGNAAASGDRGNAAASGYRGNAAASGDRGNAAASGNRGNAAASGNRGNAAASGNSGNAAASGDRGTAVVTGSCGSASALGKDCLGAAWGRNCKVQGALGCYIVAAEHDDKGNIVAAELAKVDGKTIKPDTWYRLQNGEFVEVEE